MNKKYMLFLIVLVSMGIILFLNQDRKDTGQLKPIGIQAPTAQSNLGNAAGLVESVVDFGDKKISSTVSAQTAFEALEKIANQNSLELKTKKYDFGVFVESIGEYPNTSDKAWIYYVNGQSATQAADVQTVGDGDKVEWRYEKPIY